MCDRALLDLVILSIVVDFCALLDLVILSIVVDFCFDLVGFSYFIHSVW